MRRLFSWHHKKDVEVTILKGKVSFLEEKLVEIQNNYSGNPEKGDSIQYVIENINVERLHVDKFELHNNFGALGIKELKGRLNIGANYGDRLPDNMEELMEEKNQALCEAKKSLQQSKVRKQDNSPKVNVKAKVDKENK